MSEKPTIVLVHGFWGGAAHWAKVIPILVRKDYYVHAVENPLTSLADDAERTRKMIAAQKGPVLLVGHSYGGAVITEAGNHDNVVGLVYIAAFAPDAGHIHTAHFPGGPWVRVDTHVFPGYTTPPYYDSLLAKVVVWGRDRSEAIARMRRAIDETQIGGVQTNLDFLALVLSHPRFEAGEIDVDFVERHLTEMLPLNGHVSPTPVGIS